MVTKNIYYKLFFACLISVSTLSGTTLTKSGTNILTLGATSGEGNLTGATSVDSIALDAGTIRIANSSAIGSLSSVNIANGSVLDLNNFSISIGSLSGGLTSSVTLGSGTLSANNTATTTFSGVISGAGGLTKLGSGTLTLENTNSYLGATNISAGSLRYGTSNAIPTSSAVTLANALGVNLDLNNLNAQIGSLAGGGASGGDVALGTATLTVGDNTSTSFGGVISGTGALVKIGTGTLNLSGTGSSFSGGVTISAGTLIGNTGSIGTGAIANSATVNFNQSLDGTFSSQITGATGTFLKTGAGQLSLTQSADQDTATVSAGTLLVDNTVFSYSSMLVESGATLKGTGIIGKLGATTTNQGTVAPGASIGTLSIIGDYIQASGSTLEIELSPTEADLLTATGKITIQSGSTLSLMPTPGTYSTLGTYTIMQSTGDVVTGTFSTINNSLPGFSYDVVYLANSVQLLVGIVPFEFLGITGNAYQVAIALDSVTPASGGDLDLIIDMLHFQSVEQIQASMNQMQPSNLNALDLSTQESLINLRKVINTWQNNHRASDCSNASCELCSSSKDKMNVWTDFSVLYSKQKATASQFPFNTESKNFSFGLDYQWFPWFYQGFSFSVAKDRLKWGNRQGFSHMTSFYGGVYGGFESDLCYLRLVELVGYNDYETTRKIYFPQTLFPALTRGAKSDIGGWSLLSDLELGVKMKDFIYPFVRFDYLSVQRGEALETEALSLNLRLNSHVADLFRSEFGFRFFHSWCSNIFRFAPYANLSFVYEKRNRGKLSQAYFRDIPAVKMTVVGMQPSRSCFAYGIGFDVGALSKKVFFSANYEGEVGEKYWDQSFIFNLQKVF